MQSDLPPETRSFITGRIVSLEQLETLLMLYEGADRDWSAAEINQRLRSQETSIDKWLRALVTLGLASQSGTRYRFAPSTEELRRATIATAEAYRERRIKVIELIFSQPHENLINFVRAFEFRKNP